jgi:hypothetical protein
MIPHTLLLEPGLKIRSLWNGYYYWGRPSIAELYLELRELTREIRPDWDLSKGDLKKRWQRGDKGPFFPYGRKSMEDVMKEMAGAVDQYAGSATH